MKKQTHDRIRIYDKSDDLMLEDAQKMHDVFPEDKALFEERSPMFADPFHADFQTAINDARAMPLDNEILSKAALSTEQLEALMDKGRKAYMSLIYYVKEAFPNSPVTLTVFGHDKYEKERSSQTGLPNLLDQAHRSAEDPEFKASLTAKGLTQAGIDELQTLALAIEDKNQEQEDAHNKRLLRTQERVAKLNAVYRLMEKISDASKLIFVDNPTKTQLYLLYR